MSKRVVALQALLVAVWGVFSAPAAWAGQFYIDRTAFEIAAGGPLTILTFEGHTRVPGQAGVFQLQGDEYPGVTITPLINADGLFVGIPDKAVSDPALGWESFFGPYFSPFSGEALLSVDAYKSQEVQSPQGNLMFNFDQPTSAIGVYFVNVNLYGGAAIAVFNGPEAARSELFALIGRQRFEPCGQPTALAGAAHHVVKDVLPALSVLPLREAEHA